MNLPPIPALAFHSEVPSSREGFVAQAERAIEANAQELQPTEDWRPALLMQTPDQVLVADLTAYMHSEPLKDVLGDVLLPSLVVDAGAFRAGFSSCAWAVTGKHAEADWALGIAPARSEHRVEVMQLLVMDGDGWVQRMARVKRRRLRHPQLLGWRQIAANVWGASDLEHDSMGGRFVDGLARGIREVNGE